MHVLGAGTVTNVAAYPDPAETDIDGLAVGDGRAYLIPDDDSPGLIYVYDFASGSFVTPLTAPWGATADTFSGGGIMVVQPNPLEVPTVSPVGLGLLVLLLAVGAAIAFRRRQAFD